MMSRPSDLSRLAFSATSMIALGLARPMRRASSGIAENLFGDGGKPAGRKRGMLSQRTSNIGPNTLPRTGFRVAWGALALLAGLALSGCSSTQVRTATDAAGQPAHIV